MSNKQDKIVTNTAKKVMIRMDLANNVLTGDEMKMLESIIDKLKEFDRQ